MIRVGEPNAERPVGGSVGSASPDSSGLRRAQGEPRSSSRQPGAAGQIFRPGQSVCHLVRRRHDSYELYLQNALPWAA